MNHDAVAGVPQGSRILVVDDHADSARSLARLLEIYGYEVQTARDGWEAIAVALRWRPQFVLLDIGLPGMDGYQAAATLRQEESCQDTVIIAVTGYGRSEDRDRSREAGIDHHLLKPIDHRVLLALLVQSHVPHESSGPGRSDPLVPGVPPPVSSRGDWPGREAAVRSVPSRLTGEGWDR
jgi:CheY-like chemotaxis protein